MPDFDNIDFRDMDSPEFKKKFDKIVKELEQLNPEDLPIALAKIWEKAGPVLARRFVEKNFRLWGLMWENGIALSYMNGITKSFPFSFAEPGLIRAAANDYFLNHGMELVKSLTETDMKKLKGQMTENWGIGERAFAKKFKDSYPVSQSRLELIYRTEHGLTENAALLDVSKKLGREYKVWVVIGDERSCDICKAHIEDTVPIEENFVIRDEKTDEIRYIDVPRRSHPGCRCNMKTVRADDLTAEQRRRLVENGYPDPQKQNSTIKQNCKCKEDPPGSGDFTCKDKEDTPSKKTGGEYPPLDKDSYNKLYDHTKKIRFNKDEVKAVVSDYASSSYLNGYLSGDPEFNNIKDENFKETVRRKADTIIGAINKSPLPFGVTVYRGVKADIESKMRDDPNNFKPGMIVDNPTILSTAFSRKRAFGHASIAKDPSTGKIVFPEGKPLMMQVQLPKGTRALLRSAVEKDSESSFKRDQGEFEVMVKPFTKFAVMSYEELPNMKKLVWKAIPDKVDASKDMSLPIRGIKSVSFSPNAHYEANANGGKVTVSSKFFSPDLDEGVRHHVMTHELSHMLLEDVGSAYNSMEGHDNALESLTEEKYDDPERGEIRFFMFGHGSNSATGLEEAAADTIAEMALDPEALKKRSEKAYKWAERIYDAANVDPAGVRDQAAILTKEAEIYRQDVKRDEGKTSSDRGTTIDIGGHDVHVNEDNTITLYHRTRPGREEKIDAEGLDRMQGGGELWFTDKPDAYYPESPNPVYAVNVPVDEVRKAHEGGHDYRLIRSFSPSEIRKLPKHNIKHRREEVKHNYKCPENPPGSGNFKCDDRGENESTDLSKRLGKLSSDMAHHKYMVDKIKERMQDIKTHSDTTENESYNYLGPTNISADEATVSNVSRDHPSEMWMEEEIDYANSKYNPSKHRYIVGSDTAGFTGRLPVDMISDLPGENNEHINKDILHDFKSEPIRDSIKREGVKVPILISVNHLGDAYVSEGNHRLALAKEFGLKDIPVDVRYYAGGENVDGPWKLDKFEKVHKSNMKFNRSPGDVTEEVKNLHTNRLAGHAKLMEILEKAFPEAEIIARLKSVESVQEKMDRKSTNSPEFDDISGFRIIVKNLSEVEGIVDKLYLKFKRVIVPGTSDDYNKRPKDSGYRAYHMTVQIMGEPHEIQVQTESFNEWAEMNNPIYKGEPWTDMTRTMDATRYFKQIADVTRMLEEGYNNVVMPECPPELEEAKLCP